MAPNKKNRNNKRKPIPLATKPVVMKSRKKARQVTTLFHKYTREREEATQAGDAAKVQVAKEQLEEMGGREEYQRASQCSTSFFSTSKWVLGTLARRGWLYGISTTTTTTTTTSTSASSQQKRKRPRRTTRLLEVGAINTELLDAAAETKTVDNDDDDDDNTNNEGEDGEDAKEIPKYKLQVRAIDINSMEERIEEQDFLTMPFIGPKDDLSERYDVIVCSMVLNSVTSPLDRGKMLARLYHHLRPGGLLFLTIPKFCLTKSAFLNPKIFLAMLGSSDGVGFDMEETKDSPKVNFYICRRPTEERADGSVKPLWKKQLIRNRGKKYPNQFSVVLEEDEVFGRVQI
jgi:25S rRNA (adenine2142-N1)-methyltransferase